MRSQQISRQISDSVTARYLSGRDGISDETRWELMGSDEIPQVLDLPPSNLHTAVLALTPGEAGVNAVENSALTPWKSGVNPVENSGLTPPCDWAPNLVLLFVNHCWLARC